MRGRGGHHGNRPRRGKLGELLLVALLEGPAHGYELMDRLEGLSNGSWRPSPGSVYPLLQTLEEVDLVEGHEAAGRRTFHLTPSGRLRAAERRTDALAVFVPPDSLHGLLQDESQRLQVASLQIATAATPQQVEEAIAVLRAARRSLYRLLAG